MAAGPALVRCHRCNRGRLKVQAGSAWIKLLYQSTAAVRRWVSAHSALVTLQHENTAAVSGAGSALVTQKETNTVAVGRWM